MSFLQSFYTTNLSYYALPLVWLGNHFVSPRGDLIIPMGLTNTLPTPDLLNLAEKQGKDVKRLRQRFAAHENGFQAMIPFYAAIIAGNQAGLSRKYLNGIAAAYVVLRTAYVYLYLEIVNEKATWLRTGVFWAANLCSLVTMVKAGLNSNRFIGRQ